MSFEYNSSGLRTKKTVGDKTIEYYYSGDLLVAQFDGEYLVKFIYDQSGEAIGFVYSMVFSDGEVLDCDYCYYVKNLQGDITGFYSMFLSIFREYTYDAWGNITGVYNENGNPVTDLDDPAYINPLRYRGYYYDDESGLYYLNSRYYNPEWGSFISADNQLSSIDMTGMNLYAYCGNNPVNRIDPSGEAWYHWALGAAVVAGCAVATVITCGGFAAAAGAVMSVAGGMAAATTASTIASGAFIGSAAVYGMAVISAATTSNSIKEFNSQGSWGTVAATATGAVLGGCGGYAMSQKQQGAVTNNYHSQGSTGRTTPLNLKEQLAMEQVRSNPLDGAKQVKIIMADSRWPASSGWIKMSSIVNGVEIHFVYNTIIKVFDDFKFVR